MNVKETVILLEGIMVSLFKCSDFKDEKIIFKKGVATKLIYVVYSYSCLLQDS